MAEMQPVLHLLDKGTDKMVPELEYNAIKIYRGLVVELHEFTRYAR